MFFSVVRLHHDKETLGKRFAAFSDNWCCASSDARSGKGTTTCKPMRESSVVSSTVGGSGGGNSGLVGEEETHLVDNVERTLGINQKEKLFKYSQVNHIWKKMHGVSSDSDVPKIVVDTEDAEDLFQGFLDGPVGKGMVGNVFHLTSSESSCDSSSTTTTSPMVAHYAAKCMRKEDIVAKSAGAQQVLLEIEAMKLMEHPFIIQLYCTWQTPSDLVLLLDYMPGGELFMVIRRQSSGMFPHLEPYAVRFYSACVLSALTYLHDELGYVYRDLKGENVLIDHQGFAKLCDFGFAKKLRDDSGQSWERTKTVCGTPDYMFFML
jgi:serine/threonine protein kinase